MGKGDKIIFSSQQPAGKNIKSMEGTNWEEYKVHGKGRRDKNFDEENQDCKTMMVGKNIKL